MTHRGIALETLLESTFANHEGLSNDKAFLSHANSSTVPNIKSPPFNMVGQCLKSTNIPMMSQDFFDIELITMIT
jgi:hypothetical protein